jgi:membrane protein YqaA with SNARE-associated domain
MEFLAEYSYFGLFLSSFLAATLLPFSSELVLGVLLKQGFNPHLILMVATFGNVLGSVVNYGLGAFGGRLMLHKWWRMPDPEIQRAEKRFRKFGMFSLLLAWVPVIGDPLTVAAGVLKINFFLFLLLVGLGKGLRYIAIYLAVLRV